MLFGHNSNQSSDRKTWAVALVHGIGTSQPLPMIDAVAKAIKAARPTFDLNQDSEIHSVPEAGTARYQYVRSGSVEGAKVRIGTAHWADVSYYREGVISLIGIMLMAAFGVRFFANVATAHRPGTPGVIRFFSGIVSWLLYFMIITLAVLIFPVTFDSLVFSSIGLLAEYTVRFQGTWTAPLQIAMIAGGGFVVCTLLAYIGLSRIASALKERSLGVWIFGSMILVAFALAAAMVASIWKPEIPDGLRAILLDFAKSTILQGHLPARIEITDDIGVFFALLHVLQIILAIWMLILTSLVAVGLLIYAAVAFFLGRRFNTMIFAVVSVVSIWIALSLMLWPENLANHSALSRFVEKEIAAKIGCVPVQTLKSFEDRSLPGMAKWAFEDRDTQSLFIGDALPGKAVCPAQCPDGNPCPPVWTNNQKPDGVQRTLDDTYPISWFETAYLAFLVVCAALFGLIYMARNVWISTRNKNKLGAYAPAEGKERPRASNWPRLIVSALYTCAVLLFTYGVSTYFLSRVEGNLSQLMGSPSVPHEVTIGAEFVRLAVILFVLVFVVFSTYMANGLKLVLDVVNHFTQPAQGYPVRERIEKRFDEMVEYLLAPCSKPHLVIIAHSQGTIITIDALMRDEWVKSTLDRVSSLTIVTVGSPFTHVYQQYFPREYPLLKERLEKLAAEPNVRWINAYRIDDYVGTYIENSIPRFPVNVPLPPGGHLRYWEEDVMKRIFETPEIKDFLLKA
ncbi:MAG: hypothetical protein NW216_06745 [Hyphomicrobium sp.]|nr:hypothetical protein [Hyphomicrobium sp.]